MIFVTIGSVLPFDRLVRAMDEWAARHPDTEVFAQIGQGDHEPRSTGWVRNATPTEFKGYLERCSLVVAHAGMGTIIETAEMGKPIVILPRRLGLREVNTEHQLHTAQRLVGRPGVYVALDDTELPQQVDQALSAARNPHAALARMAPQDFVDRVRRFLAGA